MTSYWDAMSVHLGRVQRDAENDAPKHGYGDESDCLCGRNFLTVRGLREHLTKSRLALSKEGRCTR